MADAGIDAILATFQKFSDSLNELQALLNHSLSAKQISRTYNAEALAAGHGVLLTISPPENQVFHVPFPSSVEAFDALVFESLSSLLTTYKVAIPETTEEARERLRDVITRA